MSEQAATEVDSTASQAATTDAEAIIDDGRRELTVRLDGEADAGFSFVVPTTVWRPSYRAIIGEAKSTQATGRNDEHGSPERRFSISNDKVSALPA